MLHACAGQEQPQVARGHRLPRPPRPPYTPVPHPPKPPSPPVTPVPPSPPAPPYMPVRHPPGAPHPRSLLQAEQPQVVRGPRPPKPPKPPRPPRPPRPPPHSLLLAEKKSETCYRFSLVGCEQMCKENGFETKHSYYIERVDSKWECCCPH